MGLKKLHGSLKKVVTEYFVNRKAENCGELDLELVQNYKVLGFTT